MHRQRLSVPGERRGVTWKFAIIFSTLIICLFVCVYQFKTLQTVRMSEEGAISAVENTELEGDDIEMEIENTQHQKKKNRTMIVLIANYRDSKRCGETIESILSNAVDPDSITFGIHDQLNETEKSCVDTYCKNVPNCRRSQIRSTMIDASQAKGPTVARYMTEELIENEDFCLSIDSHLVFVERWDEKLYAQWDSLENEYAILSAYPKGPDFQGEEIYHMCHAHIESAVFDAMIEYGPLIVKKKGPKPYLCSQLAGGFNFGNCKQALDVRNDPYTPFLFHGEEYSRATRLWTFGYDMYCPNVDVAYHWYEKRNYMWDKDWDKKAIIQLRSQRRIRKMLGLKISVEDVDLTNLEKFSMGNKRTFEQWKKFTGIDPAVPFSPEKGKQFDACGDLELVPFIQ